MCAAPASSPNFRDITVPLTPEGITHEGWEALISRLPDRDSLEQVASIVAAKYEGLTCLVVRIVCGTYEEIERWEEIGAYGCGTGVFKNVTVIKNATAEKCVITNGLNVKIVVNLGKTLVSLAPGDSVQTELRHSLPNVTFTEPEGGPASVGSHKNMPAEEVEEGFPTGPFEIEQKHVLAGGLEWRLDAQRLSKGKQVTLHVLIDGHCAVFKGDDDDETLRWYAQLESLLTDIKKNWESSSSKDRRQKDTVLTKSVERFNLLGGYNETKNFLEKALADLKKIDGKKNPVPSEEKTNP